MGALMDERQRAACLRRIDLFQDFSDRELGDLAGAVCEFCCAPGHILFAEGEAGREMFILLDGSLEVVKANRVITTIRPGESVGEMALIDELPRSATVRAAAPCLLLSLDEKKFLDLALHPASLLSMMRAMSRRIRHDTERIAQDYERTNILIHDMKNILSIFLYLDLLKRQPGSEKAATIIATLQEARANLGSMMAEAMAQARQMYRPLEPVTGSLAVLLGQMAMAEFAVHPDLRDRRIELALPPELPEFLFDPLEIRRLVLNLVLNGAQASGPDAPITITGTAEADWIEVTILDRGSGLPVELREKIFHTRVTTKPEGNGLGLPACRRIVERHRGSLEYEPGPGGIGSIFRFRLPLAGAPVETKGG